MARILDDVSQLSINAPSYSNGRALGIEEEQQPQQDGFLKSLGKGVWKGAVTDPFNALLVRPAARFGEALGAGAINIFGSEEQKKRANEYIGRDKNIQVLPFVGPTKIAGMKAFGEGGGKQILGEGLESAVDIAGLAYGGGAAKSGLVKPTSFVQGAIQGAKAGALSGGIYGGGMGTARALQENKSVADIATEGITGAVAGGVTGGVLGGVAGGISGGIRGAVNRHKEIRDGFANAQVEAQATRQATLDTLNQQKRILLDQGRDISSINAKIDKITNQPLDVKTPTNIIEYSKNPSGKIKIDSTAKNALKQGIAPEDVQFIKNSSVDDKSIFRDMYRVGEKASTDKTFTETAFQKGPGETITQTLKNFNDTRMSVGKELGNLTQSMPQTPVDITPTTNKFIENLGQAGINVNIVDNKPQLNFDNSRFANQKSVQGYLQKVYDALFKGGGQGLSPADITKARQTIFTDLKYATQKNDIVPGDFSKTIIDQVYNTLDDGLKVANPKYGELAQKYAIASGQLRDWGGVLGKNFDLTDDLTNLRAGEVGARILGNASSRPLTLVQDMQVAASQLDVPIKGNIRNQFLFGDFLENLFGSTQTRALRGQVGRGTLDAGEAVGAAMDLAKGNAPGLIKRGLNLFKGATPEAQKKAVEELIGYSIGALKFK